MVNFETSIFNRMMFMEKMKMCQPFDIIQTAFISEFYFLK